MLSGHIYSVVSRVLEYEVLASVWFFGLGAEEFGDAVIDVNDVDAWLQLLELWAASHCPAVRTAALATDAEDFGVSENAYVVAVV